VWNRLSIFAGKEVGYKINEKGVENKLEIYLCHPTYYSRTPRVSHFTLRYLSNGRYKNEKFLKNIVRYLSNGRYNGRVFLNVSTI
jgi:hypothetical protein